MRNILIFRVLLCSHFTDINIGKGKIVPVHNMKTYREVEVQLHTLFTSALHPLHHCGKSPVHIEQDAAWASKPGWIFWRRVTLSYCCQKANPGSSSLKSGHYTD
jgi:hypothetical protein